MIKNLFFVLFYLGTVVSYSQATGDIDTSFGFNGRTALWFMEGSTQYSIHIRTGLIFPDNKIVMVGVANYGCSNTSNTLGVIIRLTEDGQLDTTYNQVGYKYYMSATGLTGLSKIDDNTYYIYGATGGIMKMNANLEQDMTVGTNGFLTNTPGYFASNGLEYCVSTVGTGETAFTRWNRKLPDGTIDTTFGIAGNVDLPPRTFLNRIKEDSNHNLVIMGTKYVGTTETRVNIMKMTLDGSFITTYGTNGLFDYFPFYDSSFSPMMILNADDSIFICIYGYNHTMFLMKVTPEGTRDTTFAQGSKFINGNWAYPRSVIYRDGHYFINGSTGATSYFLSKYTPSGSLYAPFATNGNLLFTEDEDGSSATLNTMLFQGNKLITIEATLMWACAQTSRQTVVKRYFTNENFLGIPTSDQNKLNHYPNPTTGVLHIEIPTANSTLSMYNLLGQKVFSTFLADKESDIDISILTPGTYIGRIEDTDENVSTIRVEKQ